MGRGALAGCVVAAAVILPVEIDSRDLSGVCDSKLLNCAARERLFEQIQSAALSIGIGSASVREIDRFNIRVATALAMQRALARVGPVEHVLVDGLRVPELTQPQTAIVRGDRQCLAIAAASIVAKVTRDRWMRCLARRFSGYGWERNAGYGTKAHLAALHSLGVTALHRRTFAPVRTLLTVPCQGD